MVFSHSHSGNRETGVKLADFVLDHFNYVIFDYTGYGMSEKDHCTLGIKESEDLRCVIEYVKRKFDMSEIYIWGRSQGAVTTLLLADKTLSPCCKGMVLDSPFSSTKEMVAAINISSALQWRKFRPTS